MKHTLFAIWLIFLLVSAISLAACSSRHDPLFQQRFFAFGTWIEVTLWGVDKKRAEEIVFHLKDDFQTMHRNWHPWKAGSLGRMNQLLPLGEKFTASPSVLPLIHLSQDLSMKSHGLFNPAIGKLIKLWQFDRAPTEDQTPPEQSSVDKLVASQPSMNDISVDGVTIQSHNPKLLLDFGAIAKGYGLNIAMAFLKAHGVENAIINAGGDLSTVGSRGNRPWRIGIRNGLHGGVLASIKSFGSEAIFTSGNYERYFEFNNQRYHHILDPRTGYPAKQSSSVTVIHRDAAIADAAATALFIAGPNEWATVARDMAIKCVMLVDITGTIYMTRAMADRVEFEKPVPSDIRLIEIQ